MDPNTNIASLRLLPPIEMMTLRQCISISAAWQWRYHSQPPMITCESYSTRTRANCGMLSTPNRLRRTGKLVITLNILYSLFISFLRSTPRKEKSPGPPDDYRLFALRFVRLHGILFTASGYDLNFSLYAILILNKKICCSLETFEELKTATRKHLESLLARDALKPIQLMKLLLVNIFTFHRSLRKPSKIILFKINPRTKNK